MYLKMHYSLCKEDRRYAEQVRWFKILTSSGQFKLLNTNGVSENNVKIDYYEITKVKQSR